MRRCCVCDGDHLTALCPRFARQRHRAQLGFLCVGTLDQLYVRVAGDLRRAAQERRQYGFQATVSNTARQGTRGQHWFVVMYSIAVRGAGDADGADATGV